MRRDGTVRGALCVLAGVWGLAMGQTAAGQVVDVTAFGAKANDGKDDLAAVRAAIRECNKHPRPVLVFPKGRYDFFDKAAGETRRRQTAMGFGNARNLTVDGRGSTLMFHGVMGVMGFAGCDGVLVRDLTIDWDRPPMSTGKVLAAEEGQFDVEIFDEFPVKGGEPVGAVMEYDAQTLWPARRCLDIYYDIDRTELLRPQVLRVFLKRKATAKVGRLMVLRHEVYGPGAMGFNGCANVRIENVTIYTVPGMGVHASATENIMLLGLRIVPKPDSRRIVTATADATHFNGCTGRIVIDKCVFQGMGDDAVNVHGMFHRVTEIADKRTVVTVVRNDWLKPPAVGHTMEFTDPQTLLPYASGTVAAVTVDPAAKTHRITFAQDMPKELTVGHVLGNVNWAPKLEIRNCQVIGNRARGFLVQTRDAVIENNTFRHSQASGINVTTDFDHWTESIGTRKIVIRGNTFEDLNKGAEWHAGVISIFADVKGRGGGAPGVHRDILIEKNTIRDTDGAAVYVGSADGVVIRDNVIEKCCLDPGKPARAAAIYLENSRNVTITGNRLAGDRSPQMKEPVTIGPGCEADTVKVEGNEGF
jgi:polygalacturonase